jgi:CheY-like chemotaxis protein
MDCHMPEMDGYAATAAIRKLPSPTCDVPIIALTAGVSNEERRTALAAGMSAFLAKPVNREELAAALAGVSRALDTRP